ncbi:MAG: tRNA (adenosine(37)-N6)-threonylcarbamoyltransferase complex ATPase subunit type 1 TsaE [Candidatus Paceibacterota bacterium]|jgi:tRNA threonylcarbamoyladenosine biosynthesis protein TsaE
MQKVITNIKELQEFADKFLIKLFGHAHGNHACVIALSGDLGAGKTAFTKEVAKLLDITETVTSPTFVIEKIYEIPKKNKFAKHFDHLIHIDAYRLESEHELEVLGFRDFLTNPRNLILIEWPEQVPKLISTHAIMITIGHLGETTRHFTIEFPK